MEDAKAGEGGALVGPAGLAGAICGPGLTWRRLFLDRPRPMDTRLKSVRWNAGRGEYLGVEGVGGPGGEYLGVVGVVGPGVVIT